MGKKITVTFYKSLNGDEPVRNWLKSLSVNDRKAIGSDIKAIEFLWPIGYPQVRKMDTDLWEVRSHIADGIARVFFTINGSDMVLLHAIIKKSQKTPQQDLTIAKHRRNEVLRG